MFAGKLWGRKKDFFFFLLHQLGDLKGHILWLDFEWIVRTCGEQETVFVVWSKQLVVGAKSFATFFFWFCVEWIFWNKCSSRMYKYLFVWNYYLFICCHQKINNKKNKIIRKMNKNTHTKKNPPLISTTTRKSYSRFINQFVPYFLCILLSQA